MSVHCNAPKCLLMRFLEHNNCFWDRTGGCTHRNGIASVLVVQFGCQSSKWYPKILFWPFFYNKDLLLITFTSLSAKRNFQIPFMNKRCIVKRWTTILHYRASLVVRSAWRVFNRSETWWMFLKDGVVEKKSEKSVEIWDWEGLSEMWIALETLGRTWELSGSFRRPLGVSHNFQFIETYIPQKRVSYVGIIR